MWRRPPITSTARSLRPVPTPGEIGRVACSSWRPLGSRRPTRILLLSAARVVLDGSQGSIGQQLARVGSEPARLPRLVPSLASSPAPETLPRPDSLLFDNGLGGFSADGREYVIHLEPGEATPAPWVNVVANRRLGFVVSEAGGGYTWAENSGENRLTPWRNDPISDEPGEVLYLRDEETGAVWTPTPRPAPADGAYQIRYGAGYATFLHRSHGLEQSLRLWVPPDDPVKLVELTLTNRLDRPRRVTVTYFLEWVLGATRDRSQAFVDPGVRSRVGSPARAEPMERGLREPRRVRRGEREAPWTDRRPRGVPRPARQLRGPGGAGAHRSRKHGPGRTRPLCRSAGPPRPRARRDGARALLARPGGRARRGPGPRDEVPRSAPPSRQRGLICTGTGTRCSAR